MQTDIPRINEDNNQHGEFLQNNSLDLELQNQDKHDIKVVQNQAIINQEQGLQNPIQDVNIISDTISKNNENKESQQEIAQQNKLDSNQQLRHTEAFKLTTQDEKQKIEQMKQQQQDPIQGLKVIQPAVNYQEDLPINANSPVCQYCRRALKLKESHIITGDTVCCGILLAVCLTPLFCWIPCVCNDCQDKVHACAYCGEALFMIRKYEVC